jgi:hypothetical protein
MSIPSRGGPKPLSEILGELFTARGYGRIRARAELESAWADAVGEAARGQTELGEVRRGILNVTVAHSALLEELSAFGKTRILAALRTGAPGTTIHDIRFRVGALSTKKGDDLPGRQEAASKPGGAAMGPTAGSRRARSRAAGTARKRGNDGPDGENRAEPESSER